MAVETAREIRAVVDHRGEPSRDLLIFKTRAALCCSGFFAFLATVKLKPFKRTPVLIACAVILLVAGYRSFPPSIWGKATTLAEIVLVVLALSQAVWETEFLGGAREALSYIVAALVMFSGVHYSVVVARRLHAEESSA